MALKSENGCTYSLWRVGPLSLPVSAPAAPRPRRTIENWVAGRILILSRYTPSRVGAQRICTTRSWSWNWSQGSGGS